VSIDDLQKALDKFAVVLFNSDPPDAVHEAFNVLKNDIASFRVEYDKQVHPSRKQVQDKIKSYLTSIVNNQSYLFELIEIDDVEGVVNDFVDNFLLKDEASLETEKPHFLTVGEAREQLKESSKPRNVYACGER